MRTVAPGGRLPTLMVNTSCRENKHYKCSDVASDRSEGRDGRTYRGVLVHQVGAVAFLYSLLVLLASCLLFLHLRHKHTQDTELICVINTLSILSTNCLSIMMMDTRFPSTHLTLYLLSPTTLGHAPNDVIGPADFNLTVLPVRPHASR